MQFRFEQDTLDLVEGAREYLQERSAPETLRALVDEGRTELGCWSEMAEMGLLGFQVPEAHGGMGMDEAAFALVAQEAGQVALPDPLVDVAGVAVAVLKACQSDKAAAALAQIAAGERRVLVSHGINPYVNQLTDSDVLLHIRNDSVHLLDSSCWSCELTQSIDPLRSIGSVQSSTTEESCLASGSEGTRLAARALHSGAVFAAAELAGLAQAMLAMATAYAKERQQFGSPIGTFQAVKHHLASAFVKLEFARPVIYRAATSLSEESPAIASHVAHAKIAAADAAMEAAEVAIQVHGAMGYTFEANLHLWMKRAWALAGLWGDRHFHMQRLQRSVLDDGAVIGPAVTFT